MNAGFETVQRSSIISFPFLGNLTLNPPASFSLFGREIYFYGVIVALAFLAGLLYAARQAPRFGISSDDIYDLMLRLLPASILGARLYFVLFRLQDYLASPWEIFAVWEGGLAIYGGILAGFLTVLFFSRRRKIPTGDLLDLVILGCMLGQAIGRWGNFMNREAFGCETDFVLRMGLTDTAGNTIYVHPTFLYESVWNLAGFLFLNRMVRRRHRAYAGQILYSYFFWYGLGRFWIEGLRTDSLYLWGTGIRVSQAVSLGLMLFGAAMLLLHRRSGKFSPRTPSSKEDL